MTLDEDECWARLAGAGHGVLATVHPIRGVDAVPVVYAVVGSGERRIVIPVDTTKAKRSTRLQRLANIDHDARCVLLVDHYQADWSQLWWVRIHAVAVSASVSDGSVAAVVANLADRYPQYRQPGSVVAIITLDPTEVTGWRA